MSRFKVGILGATGAVGQKFVRLLQKHPWFEIQKLGASERSANQKYWEAARWIEDIPLPENIAGMNVYSCSADNFEDVDFVFSGLDSSVATDIEQEFAESAIPVISNAKNYRMDDAVPLLIPEINPEHISLIRSQSFTDNHSGWIVTNPNCVCIPLAMSLKPIYDQFGIEAVNLTSMQAVSGAGYPGVPSLDILGNVMPFIDGEESKIHIEPLKLLGTVTQANSIDYAKFPIEATATRVPTIDGHLLSVTVKLSDPPSDIEEVKRAIRHWSNPIADLDLPSAPSSPIKLYENNYFPQPRMHATSESGMQLGMGRLRNSRVFDISYVAMAHNTIRGAAGGAVLNAELLVNKGYLTET